MYLESQGFTWIVGIFFFVTTVILLLKTFGARMIKFFKGGEPNGRSKS